MSWWHAAWLDVSLEVVRTSGVKVVRATQTLLRATTQVCLSASCSPDQNVRADVPAGRTLRMYGKQMQHAWGGGGMVVTTGSCHAGGRQDCASSADADAAHPETMAELAGSAAARCISLLCNCLGHRGLVHRHRTGVCPPTPLKSVQGSLYKLFE